MSKRVICIMGRILDQDDGLAVYATNVLKNVFRMDSETRYVILLRTPKHEGLFRDHANVETLVRPARIKLLWDQYVVPKVARQVGADIILNPKFSIPLLTRRPSIFVLHGSDWYVNPQNYEWWDNIYIRVMLPLYCWKAKRLFAISQTIVDDLVRYAKIDASKVTVSYAAASSQFHPNQDPEECRRFAERYELPDRFILTVARAYHTGHGKQPPYPGGNLERLTRAYQEYRREGGTLPLVVAGERIRDYLLTHGFGEEELAGLHFTGFIPHAKIQYAYSLAEYFVLATLYESFALPMIESMACGCPAIVPTTGACPEIAGGAARLANPLDPKELTRALIELGEDDEERARLREKGIHRAAEFNWDRTARLTLKVFDEVAPRKVQTST